jgi:exodeoxyribonuclease VII large subunit
VAVHSVSDVTKYIKGLLDHEDLLQGIQIRGEISNFKKYTSGHCYFTLKDAASSLKCVMFRSRAQALQFLPANGMKVVAAGSLSVYERDGVYQLYVDNLWPEGAGERAVALEQLKVRLTAEGLFAEAHKKPLPVFPRKIGVVTSISGAVLRDIYHVAKRRDPSVQLVLCPVQVQGEDSAGQVAAAIAFFNAHYPVDVLIVGRGGGSAEDLWAFNEEPVARAIYASRIPVISAVGHETDYTLADFAADVRAATPSQAAELAVPDMAEFRRHVTGLCSRMEGARSRLLTEKRSRLLACLNRPVMKMPQSFLAPRRQRLDMAAGKLQQLIQAAVSERKQQCRLQMERLELLNPLRVLRRGYGIVEDSQGVLHSIRQVQTGDLIGVTLADGQFQAQVTSVHKGGQV